MRTRRQSKRAQSLGEQEASKDSHVGHGPECTDDNETLSNISRDAVGKLLKRVKKGFNKEDVSYLSHDESAKIERGRKDGNENCVETTSGKDTANSASYAKKAAGCAANPEKDSDVNAFDDSEWEDGHIPTLSTTKDFQEGLINGVSVEFDVSDGLVKRKPVRRATSEEKEIAELVHKAHLLCLLGRGRLMDCACNDPLIQASLLSLVPTHLLKIAESPKFTARQLSPLVSWFYNKFHVRSPNVADTSCQLSLASALETHEGTPEAIAALSVALFRALNLTVRFVSILDVVSLKPDGDKSASSMEVVSMRERGMFSSSTLMVAGPDLSPKPLQEIENDSDQTAVTGSKDKADKSAKNGFQSQDALAVEKSQYNISDVLISKAPTDASEPCLVKHEGLKRKGDLEFEMQLEIALAATAIGASKRNEVSNAGESSHGSSALSPPFKKMKAIKKEESQTSTGICTAIGSKKVGAPLYWAEVFCSGENLTGRWVHVDAVNAIIDGEHKVEAAAAACKRSLRYVVAFAGHGAKDVTRRYCTKWYKVAAQRINSTWWDAVMAPLKELESGETGGAINVESETSGLEKVEASQVSNPYNGCLVDKNSFSGASEGSHEIKAGNFSMRNLSASTRSSLEDMELETRALTEPLPTNQQAYRNHHLYVIERWLKKYEILYPKGPVLGFCSGHPVYPRTCVQSLHTKQMWLREGQQVKAGEVPAKILKRSQKHSKEEAEDDNDHLDEDDQGITALYGRWQTEPLCLPTATNGIVPKNGRGQVDVWSEKCLPPGTVHLPLPRVWQVARRLDIDYAPAMVGFESRNGRSVPVFNGIVVCTEFKDAILEAYLEEEESREAEEKRKNEAEALKRWYQLLSSIITRQRLNESYGPGVLSESSSLEVPKAERQISVASASLAQKTELSPGSPQAHTPEKHGVPPHITADNHDHDFILEEQADGEEGGTLIKRCHCGFSIQFEEL